MPKFQIPQMPPVLMIPVGKFALAVFKFEWNINAPLNLPQKYKREAIASLSEKGSILCLMEQSSCKGQIGKRGRRKRSMESGLNRKGRWKSEFFYKFL